MPIDSPTVELEVPGTVGPQADPGGWLELRLEVYAMKDPTIAELPKGRSAILLFPPGGREHVA